MGKNVLIIGVRYVIFSLLNNKSDKVILKKRIISFGALSLFIEILSCYLGFSVALLSGLMPI